MAMHLPRPNSFYRFSLPDKAKFHFFEQMIPEKKYRWIKVAESAAELFNTGRNMATVRLPGRDICITRFNNELYGCAAKCPHAGGRMADGWVDALGNVVCPLHRYKFKLNNGFNSSGEGYYLKTYAVKETDDGLFVGLDA